MGDVSPDAGNPSFDIDVAGGGVPFKVRLPFHQGDRGLIDFVFSPWITIPTYQAIKATCYTSQAAFDAAVAASPWANFYAVWYNTPASRLVARGLVAQTAVPQPTSALGLPP